jgi:hypothetical protein
MEIIPLTTLSDKEMSEAQGSYDKRYDRLRIPEHPYKRTARTEKTYGFVNTGTSLTKKN